MDDPTASTFTQVMILCGNKQLELKFKLFLSGLLFISSPLKQFNLKLRLHYTKFLQIRRLFGDFFLGFKLAVYTNEFGIESLWIAHESG